MPEREVTAGFFRRPLLLALFLLVIGGYLAVQGIVLLTLGGSIYYFVTGLAVVAVALLLALGRREACWLYAAMLLGTLCWSLYEVGTDFWQLLPRLAGPGVFGLWIMLPRTRRRLSSSSAFARLPGGWVLLGGGILLAIPIGLGLHMVRDRPIDPVFQRGVAVSPAPGAAIVDGSSGAAKDWIHYGGDAGGQRFSQLDQITPDNVSGLKAAWIFRVGTTPQGRRGSLQAVPQAINGTLYICTSINEVIAIDQLTGRQKWRFDPRVKWRTSGRASCRGMVYYRVPNMTGPCAERIIGATIDARLFAVDAASGRACAGFGRNGQISLLRGMGRVLPGYYYVSSAPTIARGKVIVGGRVIDGQYWGEPSGVIRGFDAVTGRFALAFDVGRLDRQSEPPAGEHYTYSTPNSWAPMSADETLGLVYAPTGNSVPDYYGAQRRPFDDRFSSAVVAIEAETGKLRWVFQTVHHDVWDYDVASQPVLLDIPGGRGGVRRALLQPTKRGEIFLLDRVTGKPIAPVTEVPVSQSGAAPGERLSPTQAYSTGMPSFRGADLVESDMWGLTPLDQLWCRIAFRRARYDGPLTPPGLTSWIEYPGFAGGMNWGSVSINPQRMIMTVTALHFANYNRLLSRREADRMGLAPQKDAEPDGGGPVAQANTRFAALITPFMSPLLVPCQAPPFGTISAVDLRTRKLIWTEALGTAAGTGPLGIDSRLPIVMGSPNVGGALNTRSGITFVAATPDSRIRAFDAATGKLLWHARLPVGGQSTPISYQAPDGRQMIAIAAGGTATAGSDSGGYIVAFALPRRF